MSDDARTVLIAPDSFKGSLTSVQVAKALADGWARARPQDEIVLSPLADGGEGTLEAVAAAGRLGVADDRRPRPARARRRGALAALGATGPRRHRDGDGLRTLTGPTRRIATRSAATSIGTGELISDGDGRRTSRTSPWGSAAAPPRTGAAASSTRSLERWRRRRRLDRVDLAVACDVTNPLLGPTGAAAIFGPQKGATPEQVRELDERNARWADELEAREGRRERDTPGAGAAGGVGFALLAIQDRFRSFALRPGVDLVMEATGFDEKLARADLVITGEGRIDAQTAFGKTALGVAKRAQAAGVACIAVGGGVEPEGVEALAAVGAVAVPVTERPQTVEAAMAAGTAPLERCGERVARLVSIGAAAARPDDPGPSPRPAQAEAAPEEAQVLRPRAGHTRSDSSATGRASSRTCSTAGRPATAASRGSAGSTRRASSS